MLDIERIRDIERDYRVDIHNRIVYMTGDIEEYLLEDLIFKLKLILDYNNNTLPITICINSSGGDVSEMFAIMDYIKLFPVKINTCVIGKAISAAAVLLTAGTGKRYATKNSTIMFHESSGMTYGKASDQKSYIKYTDNIEKRVNKFLSEVTDMPESWWENNQKIDMWLTAEEALKYGIIDEII